MEFKCRNINDAFSHIVGGIHAKKIPVEYRPSRYGDCLTIPEPVVVTYHRPMEKVLFNQARDVNVFFTLYESLWMLAGRNDVAPLQYYASRMGEFSDDGETFNAAYGHRWRHWPVCLNALEDKWLEVDQLDVIAAHLTSMTESRRAVLEMWDVKEDLLKIGGGICPTCEGEWTEAKAKALDETFDGKCPNCGGDVLRPYTPAKGSRDVACNLAARFHLRPVEENPVELRDQNNPSYRGTMATVKNYLDMTVFNRSNDLTWGALGANAVHFAFLLEYMAAKIGAQVGIYNQISDDLHCYVAKGRWEPEKWLDEEVYRDMHSPARVDYDKLQLLPLVFDPEAFDAELPLVVEHFSGGIKQPNPEIDSLTEPFFRHVAAPLLRAFELHKTYGETTQAIRMCKLIQADDWRIAATAWLERRLARKGAK